ncbi:hypothetical protein N7452_009129 [Penicillium brevicompactum]|uniref:F-box domain-containing protein n=1 Tax=Penicillium brevicompactum TaxID=5074 RepID=A0A9W9Q7S6_PENBR|nr:hypothetical protein N7452_009129 [Penicillium brevicompactum]
MGVMANLPFELLRLIVVELDSVSLKSFSLVNKSCRSVSTPDIFRSFKFEFSEQGMKKLEWLADSSLAQCVRILHYEASELVDPLIQHWDYFSACIYTPQEYARDQEDFRWELRGKQFSYRAIFSYFRKLARAQSMVLKERMDIHIFTGSLRNLSNLNTVKLSFHGTKEDQLLWFSNRLFLGGENSLLVHLEAVFRGVAAAQDTGLTLKYLEIDGMHSKLTSKDSNILEVAKTALAKVESLTLIDSPGSLEFLSSVPLTSLRRLELAKFERVGIKVDPSEVRLKTEDGCLYAWQIEDPSLEHIFQKHMSKHSIGTYMLLHREVGQKFRAIPAMCKEEQTELDIVAHMQAENLSLADKLRAAEDKAFRYEEAATEAEAEIKDQNSIIREAQMTIHIHQQDILNWMAVAEWYQMKCFQCSNVLGQMMAFLQDTTSKDG